MTKALVQIKKWISSLKRDPYAGMNVEERFTKIYHANDWKDKESVSGPGSNSEQTTEVIRIIEKVIQEYSISSILDLPCGDFGWMKQVNLGNARYIGGDIVEELIEANQKKYANIPNVSFQTLNLIKDELPAVDLLIVRDCLVHLNNEQITEALSNIRNSKIQYLLTTTFVNRDENLNIHTGDWRPINLQLPPFSLHQPLAIYNERCTENNGKFADKSLALYKIETSA